VRYAVDPAELQTAAGLAMQAAERARTGGIELARVLDDLAAFCPEPAVRSVVAAAVAAVELRGIRATLGAEGVARALETSAQNYAVADGPVPR